MKLSIAKRLLIKTACPQPKETSVPMCEHQSKKLYRNIDWQIDIIVILSGICLYRSKLIWNSSFKETRRQTRDKMMYKMNSIVQNSVSFKASNICDIQDDACVNIYAHFTHLAFYLKHKRDSLLAPVKKSIW